MGESSGERATELLKEMTLKEKIGQMIQIELHLLEKNFDKNLNKNWQKYKIELDQGAMQRVLVDYGIGSIISGGSTKIKENSAEGWANLLGEIHDFTSRTRLKIPVIYGLDAVHGSSFVIGGTIYPHNIGVAATWNPDLAQRYTARTSDELAAMGINWNFAPTIDVLHDSRWGRTYETFGEDPFLSAVMAKSSITGFQRSGKLMACAKHFVATSACSGGKDRGPIDISERTIREVYLPPFLAAIEAGVGSIMINSGELNGVPCNLSKWLISDLLQGELGFKGITISDWEDIARMLWFHKTSIDKKEAAARAFNAGLDVYMATIELCYADYLLELAETGKIPLERIDQAVLKILTQKFRLGLFDSKKKSNPVLAKKLVGDKKSRELARLMAEQSLTLLKNRDGLLPLSKNLKSILIAGSGANKKANLCGGWTVNWQAAREEELPDCMTILEAFKARAGERISIDWVDEECKGKRMKEALKGKDVCILVISEKPYAEFVGDSLDLALTEKQRKMVTVMMKSKVPIVLIGLLGRPAVIDWAIDKIDSFIWAYLPGSEGAQAIAGAVFGDINPGGKLPFSYPKNAAQLPLVYNARRNSLYEPLYPFGFGLSYSEFVYSGLTVPENAPVGGKISIGLSVQNVGKMAGDEVVQLFIEDRYASVSRPVKQLQGFERVHLEPGEIKTVQLFILPEQLSFLDENLKRVNEPRVVVISVGTLEKEVRIG